MIPVLYVVACGAPPATELGSAIRELQTDGWDVCIVATPMALRFIDVPSIEETSGHVVRSEYRRPGEQDPFPSANAVAVAPCTFNTLNKWAAGMSDTLALGILNEFLSSGPPIVAGVWAKESLRRHPAFTLSLRTLRSAGVHFISEGSGPDGFDWDSLRNALKEFLP